MAILIECDSRKLKVVKPKKGKTFKLEELQGFVEGLIEFYHLDDDDLLILNEEGAIEKLPINYPASYIAGICLRGNVLYCNPKEIE